MMEATTQFQSASTIRKRSAPFRIGPMTTAATEPCAQHSECSSMSAEDCRLATSRIACPRASTVSWFLILSCWARVQQKQHPHGVNAFVIQPQQRHLLRPCRRSSSPSSSSSPLTQCSLIAPPGSGYARPEDDTGSQLPDTYEPMMAFPGTMRPGKTPENMPFQDLPIADDDPDPVPWPHFQQIEWHHRWSEPPHEHPGTMESFIDGVGRWATVEQEAAMRSGVRRDVRQRQEQADSEKKGTIITDDDDDEYDDESEDYEEKEEPVALGDGMFGKLGSDADRAATAVAVSPDNDNGNEVSTTDDAFVDDGLDDFLLDLGLDSEVEDDSASNSADGDAGAGVIIAATGTADDSDDADNDETVTGGDKSKGVTATINVDDDDELSSLGLDDDDDLESDGVSTVPLEAFGDGDSDSLDTENVFDEGGFDFDDGDFGGGDDVW